MKIAHVYYLILCLTYGFTHSVTNYSNDVEDDSITCLIEAEATTDVIDRTFSGRLSDDTLTMIWMDIYEACIVKENS
jgi:hypothetical protein